MDAASSAAISIFFICIIMAALARDAAAVSGSLNSRGNTSDTICQEMPKRSVSQPHMLSLPPSLSRADHSLSALRAAGFEVLGWGQSAKGLVGPVVIEAVGEGVDEASGGDRGAWAGRRRRRTRIAMILGRARHGR
jgi:hypothetical protein